METISGGNRCTRTRFGISVPTEMEIFKFRAGGANSRLLMVSEMRTSLSRGSRPWLSEVEIEVLVCELFPAPRWASLDVLLLSLSFAAPVRLLGVEDSCD